MQPTKVENPIVLSYQYYRVPVTHPNVIGRQDEIDKCLVRNVNSGFFSEINLMVEGQQDYTGAFEVLKGCVSETKVNLHILGRRFMFSDGFSVPAAPGTLLVVINADIYFKELGDIAALGFDQFAAISRWDIPEGQSTPVIDLEGGINTQDTWVCRAPVNPELVRQLAFPQGHWHCENRLAFQVDSAGYRLCNPCASVVTVHLHRDDYRLFDFMTGHIFTRGPYGTVGASKISDSGSSYLFADWRRTDTQERCFCSCCKGTFPGLICESVPMDTVYIAKHDPAHDYTVLQQRFEAFGGCRVVLSPGITESHEIFTQFKLAEFQAVLPMWAVMMDHLANIRHFYESGAKYGLFFEGNIIPNQKIGRPLTEVVKLSDQHNLDLVLLAYWPFVPDESDRIATGDAKFGLYSYSEVCGAHMYLLSRPYAKYLLETYTLEWAAARIRTTEFRVDLIVTKDTEKRGLIYPPLGDC